MRGAAEYPFCQLELPRRTGARLPIALAWRSEENPSSERSLVESEGAEAECSFCSRIPILLLELSGSSWPVSLRVDVLEELDSERVSDDAGEGRGEGYLR